MKFKMFFIRILCMREDSLLYVLWYVIKYLYNLFIVNMYMFYCNKKENKNWKLLSKVLSENGNYWVFDWIY